MRKSMMAVVAATVLAGTVFGALPAAAAEHTVRMLNKGADGVMVFEPSFLKAAPGDTVHFVATDKGHNVLSVEGMMPEGATPFQGKMNEDVTVTLDKPGVYAFECKPHYGMGMVGLIVVGDPTNLAQAKGVSHKGKAKQRFEALFGNVGQ
jgi:pseudoazurin